MDGVGVVVVVVVFVLGVVDGVGGQPAGGSGHWGHPMCRPQNQSVSRDIEVKAQNYIYTRYDRLSAASRQQQRA